MELYVDGALQSAATAANTAGRGKPVQIVFADTRLHGSLSTRTWYCAHLAVLDGELAIGRRFVRRSPKTVASFNQMAGSLDALKDKDIATWTASAVAGQRLSFSLTGPSSPAANSAIAGVHIKQIAQGDSGGPQARAGFLRIRGVTHDAPAGSGPALSPKPVYSSWALNLANASPWTSATLPAEVGLRSA